MKIDIDQNRRYDSSLRRPNTTALHQLITITDEYTRYCLSIQMGRSITAKQVKSVLQELFVIWGKPDSIKSENGPEFVAKEIQNWLKRSGIGIQYIDPGSPLQNCFNESFNSVFGDGCLDR